MTLTLMERLKYNVHSADRFCFNALSDGESEKEVVFCGAICKFSNHVAHTFISGKAELLLSYFYHRQYFATETLNLFTRDENRLEPRTCVYLHIHVLQITTIYNSSDNKYDVKMLEY